MRRIHALLPLFITACFATSACVADTDHEEDEVTAESEAELVSGVPLLGSELPPKTVVLTFDDGPSARTAELADFLAAKGIKAAFFINGANVAGRQGAINRIIARGHTLANHTQTHHIPFTGLSDARIVSEIKLTDDIIKAAQPGGPWLLRTPGGAWNSHTQAVINRSPMKKYVGNIFWDSGGELTSNAAADWDCFDGGADGDSASVQRCGELYLKEIRRDKRGVVLFHDRISKTIDMVKTVIVPTLIAEGYKFAPITSVPSIKRAMTAAVDDCASATLGRSVKENVCVQQSPAKGSKWFRCKDSNWVASSATDAKCTSRVPFKP